MKSKAKTLAEGNPLEFGEGPGDLQALPGGKGSMPSVSLGNRTVASPSESGVKGGGQTSYVQSYHLYYFPYTFLDQPGVCRAQWWGRCLL